MKLLRNTWLSIIALLLSSAVGRINPVLGIIYVILAMAWAIYSVVYSIKKNRTEPHIFSKTYLRVLVAAVAIGIIVGIALLIRFGIK